jgi:phosphonate transport system substrate-binding protein
MSLASLPIIRFANYLSPLLQETYESIASYIATYVNQPTVLHIGQNMQEFSDGLVDVGFVCGLLYVRMAAWSDCPVELLAAPVLHGKLSAEAYLLF